jgi:tetratricopeptide (TPR) repeat protein
MINFALPVARARFTAVASSGLLALASLTFSPAPARAAEPSPKAEPSPEAVAEAGQRYDRGLKLYSEGEYRLAVIEFERTYELVPNYRVLFNIGQVRIQLGDYARARLALERYLREGDGELPPARLESVKGDLDMLEGRTATLKIQSSVVGAEVLVDGESVGVTPLPDPVLMNAGDHSIEVRKTGYRSRVLRRTLAGKDAGEMSVELDEIATTPATQTDANRAAATRAPARNVTPIWIRHDANLDQLGDDWRFGGRRRSHGDFGSSCRGQARQLERAARRLEERPRLAEEPCPYVSRHLRRPHRRRGRRRRNLALSDVALTFQLGAGP